MRALMIAAVLGACTRPRTDILFIEDKRLMICHPTVYAGIMAEFKRLEAPPIIVEVVRGPSAVKEAAPTG